MSHHAEHHESHFGAHGHKGHGHVIVNIWTLRLVLAALLFFTFATVGAAWIEGWISSAFSVEIPQPVNVIVALSIAVVKTVLVVLFFMQLKYDNPLNSMIFIFTIITVAFFLGFTSLDVGNRRTIDNFKGRYINTGGSIAAGGAPAALQDRVSALSKKMQAVGAPPPPPTLSIVELSRLEEKFGLRQDHGHGHGHAHAAHDHHGELHIITNAGYHPVRPERGSSGEISRPVQGVTLPGFADSGHGAHGAHGDHGDHGHDPHDKPVEQPGKPVPPTPTNPSEVADPAATPH